MTRQRIEFWKIIFFGSFFRRRSLFDADHDDDYKYGYDFDYTDDGNCGGRGGGGDDDDDVNNYDYVYVFILLCLFYVSFNLLLRRITPTGHPEHSPFQPWIQGSFL